MSIYQISLSFEQHFHPAQVLKKVFTIHTATVTGIPDRYYKLGLRKNVAVFNTAL